jgi:hypothetical protein
MKHFERLGPVQHESKISTEGSPSEDDGRSANQEIPKTFTRSLPRSQQPAIGVRRESSGSNPLYLAQSLYRRAI